MNTKRGCMVALSLCFALLLSGGCARNPTTGNTDLIVMTQGREIRIGDEMHQKLLDEGARYDNPSLQSYVDKIGQRLVAASDRADMHFTFTVLDSPDINAFATPGGYVYVNRGLLAYLDNEAELAGVLGHEIGHVTARHAARQQTASVTNQVLAATAYILTGSGDIADASSMYGAELVSGYGREHELEADSLGARYMHKAGYDPDSLLDVIGVLKDQEEFQRVKAQSAGKKTASYHGLYASHPRNDQRLQTVIRAASELENDSQAENPAIPGEFQQQVEGLVWGASVQNQRSENRYYHNKLGFTFEHPPQWTVTAGARAIVATAADGRSSLTITVRRRNASIKPQALLEDSAAGALSGGTELEQAGLKGYTAVATAENSARRLAVIDFNGLSYLFEGKAADFAAGDGKLLTMIKSFRPMDPRERQTGSAHAIHYIQVPRGSSIASLAASSRIADAEALLRLINGLYPSGEPRTGDWIKIIK